jgi:hypothetical protein
METPAAQWVHERRSRSARILIRMQYKIVLLLLLCLAGCAGGPATFSLVAIEPTPPSLLVARVSPRTAVLVVDAGRVPDEIPVLVGGENRGGSLVDFHEFVRRDLRRVFLNYFQDVQVVAAGDPTPPEPHIVIDVKVDRVEVLVTQRTQDGILTRSSGYASMTWGLAIRASEAPDYLYSYAGENPGAPADDPSFVFRSMLESAIAAMLKGYTDKEIQKTILDLPAPAPVPAAAPGTST